MPLSLPRWIAHRGGGALAPENTLAGIRCAAALGFRAVEFDVMLSADGTPCLIHDETLERTTSGRGRVAETPDSELFQLDAGQGERVPRLLEALDLCAELNLLANVEIKPATGYDCQTAEAVAAVIGRRSQPALLLSSFSPTALAVLKEHAPDRQRALLFDALPPDWLQLALALDVFAVHCDAELVDAERVRQANAAGLPLLAYTVNLPEQAAHLLEIGVAGMFTDNLRAFAAQASLVAQLPAR